MFTDDNGIVRFENSDEITPLHTALNTALVSVSEAVDTLTEDDTGWVPLSYESGFESQGGSYEVGVRRIGKLVKMTGLIRTTSGSLPSAREPVATLPQQFRPSSNLIFAVGTTDNRNPGTLFIFPGGSLEWRPGTGTQSTYFGLDSCSWWID